MINGKIVPTKTVVSGLAKALDPDVRYLEKLAEEIRKDLNGRATMTKLALLLLGLITAAAFAEDHTSAYWNSAEMRDACSPGSKDMETCLGYFQGVSDTLHAFQSADLLSKNAHFCIPFDVKAPELRDIFLKQVVDDPTTQHMSAASVALVAFGRAYPCGK